MFINSNSMGLPIPSVGLEPGANYAYDVNTCFTLIDAHDHSPGKGVQITPAGININASLDMQGQDLININNLVLEAQLIPSSVLQSLSVAPGTESPPLQDLWYTDNAGNKVQLTSNGLVNATIASLPGESYAAGTFFWKQGTGSTTPANFDIGSITIRPNVPLTTYGVTLAPSAGISSAYTLTLPLIPASQSFVTLDASGVLLPAAPDNVTIQIVGNIVSVKDSGVTTSKIQDGAVTGIKLGAVWQYADFTANGTVTLPSNVQECFIEGVGSGGGGGSGGRSPATPSGGGGGGGGGGNSPLMRWYKATAGEILTVTVPSAGGTGGAQQGLAGNGGNPGIAGTASSVSSNLNGVIFRSGFGTAGGPGGFNSNGAGAAGPALTTYATLLQVGAGSATSNPTSNPGLPSSVSAAQALGGAISSGGTGGGGGGTGYGVGGGGGDGGNQTATPGTPGGNANSLSYGAGGGGGGGGSGIASGGHSGAGGNGAGGFVRVMWLGAPP